MFRGGLCLDLGTWPQDGSLLSLNLLVQTSKEYTLKLGGGGSRL